MHSSSLNEMKKNLEFYAKGGMILDVGSMNIRNKGCYKTIIPFNCLYFGIDGRVGSNVDVVVDKIFPFAENTFDFMISGQCFEHTKNPFILLAECVRVLKIGGLFLGVAPSQWHEHREPIDCWRILPDGWSALFEETGLKMERVYVNPIKSGHEDCWGIGRK